MGEQVTPSGLSCTATRASVSPVTTHTATARRRTIADNISLNAGPLRL